jgi:peptidoglycan-associated lipoprotein
MFMRSLRNTSVVVCVLAAVLALGACRSKPPAPETSGTGTGQDSSLDRPATVGQDADAAAADADSDSAAGPAGGALDKRVIFFEFDSSEIRGDGPEIVAAHAKYLAGKPIRVRLEGHTDERGSREYNIGLGERRAQAVRRALMLQGAADNQLATVSYGEERPVATGTEETAWQQNRRVEIIYLR